MAKVIVFILALLPLSALAQSTYDTVTICDTCMYSSLSAAEAAEDSATDLTAAGSDKMLIYLIKEGSSPTRETAEVEFNGITTDATHYIKIVATGGARHGGKWTSTAYNWDRTTGVCLDIYADYTVVEGIQFVDTTGSQGGYGIVVRASTPGVVVNDCLFGDLANHAIWCQSDGNPAITIYNCIAYHDALYAFRIDELDGTNDTAFVYNCTFVMGGSAVSMTLSGTGTDPGGVITNCLIDTSAGTGAPLATTISDINYCASTGDLSTYGGTGNRSSQTFTFEDAGNDDYHLASSDAGARDYGTDLSGTFTDDIDDETRSGTWDIGADEYIAAGGGEPSSRRRIMLNKH